MSLVFKNIIYVQNFYSVNSFFITKVFLAYLIFGSENNPNNFIIF